MSQKQDAIVIGAGLGGIAIALRLRAKGFNVLVLERNSTYGGKLSEFSFEGYRWDKGPSLFTLPGQVDELFDLFNKNPAAKFGYKKIEETFHYYFSDGTDFLFVANPTIRDKAIRAHFNSKNAEATIDYFAESKKTYEGIGDFFVDNPKNKFKNLLDKALVKRYPKLLSLKLMRSLHAYNKSKFDDPNLIQLFDRHATYNGSDPYQMSGLYSMISHLEINDGTYFPTNGMRSIASSLYELAVEEGVVFKFDQKELNVLQGVGHEFTVETKDDSVKSTYLISAIDNLYFYRDVLKNKKLYEKYKRKERSTSAFVFYWAVETIIPALKLHNVFFSSDYQHEFKTIFKEIGLIDEPTVYIHVSSVVNPEDAPENGQNWFVMINAPAGKKINDEQRDLIRNYIFKLVLDRLKVDIKPFVRHESHWDPIKIDADTGGFEGALYGASSNSKLAALTRHGNDSKDYKNLFFCGGTVHPGGGIPLVLKSSKIVSQLIDDAK